MVTLTPVDFDPFANASSATEGGRVNTVTVRPAAQGAGLRLVPVDLLLGALFLVFVHTLARSLHAAEIPSGVLPALVGAPVFAVLLR